VKLSITVKTNIFIATAALLLIHSLIPLQGATYTQDFNGFDNGTIELGDGSVITGEAARVIDGRLQLTRDGEGLGFSSFSIPSIEGSSEGFTVTFDYELNDGPGSNDPADGFSFNYGNAELGERGQAEEGMAGRPGVTENISFEVDTWRNGDSEQGVNISGIHNGEDQDQHAFENGVILNDGQRVSGRMEMSWNPQSGATFKTTGLVTNANFNNVEIINFEPNDNHTFIISARVGGANQDLFIDNITISTESSNNPGDPDDPDNPDDPDEPDVPDPIRNGELFISEFCARNDTILEDEDKETSDWIEIYNGKETAVNLEGYYLSDNTEDLTKWKFPAVTIQPYQYLVVFASTKDRRNPENELHTNFALDGDKGQLVFLEPDGLTILSEFNYGEQVEDTSFGELVANNTFGFFDKPTPGAVNNTQQFASAPGEEIQFDKPGGLFSGTIQLTILPPESPNAVIRYTTNNSEPSSRSAIYNGNPITIRETTTIRARIFESGREPSRVRSRTFIELNSNVVNFNSALPIIVVDSNGANLDDGNRNFRFTYNVVIDKDPKDGLARMTGPADFQGRSGMHVRGQSSSGFAKKQYAWEINNNEGEDKDESILGMPKESDWIIHAPYSDKTLMRNVMVYNLARDLWGNRGGVRTRFVELFMNTRRGSDVSMSDYRGVYVLMEKIKISEGRVEVEPLENDVTDPELIQGGYIFKKDKSPYSQPWSTAVERVPLDMHDPERISTVQFNYLKNHVNDYERALHGEDFEDPTKGYGGFINVQSFIDNHLFVECFKEIDGYRISSYFVKPRYDKIRALPVWDYNLGLGNANYLGGENPTGWYYPQVGGSDYYWYQRLFESREFRLAYWDRFWELRRSTFSDENLMSQIDRWDAELDAENSEGESAATRNFNKWRVLGSYLWPNAGGYRNRRTHQSEVDWMKNWLTRRMAWVETQSKGTAAGNRDFANPPEFNQFGGEVSSNFRLRITDPNDWARSTIYYTTDGSDPRVPGNARGIVTTLIKEDSNCEVLVPSETNGGSDLTVSQWTNTSTPPNGNNWTSGTQGVGIERSPSGTYDSNIGVDVEEEMYRINPSVYIRVPFNVNQEQIESFTQLTLRVKYDDSFVAYLNGEEVSRDAERSPADLAWNSRATSTHSDSLALTFIEFDITPFIGSLKAGENMLALHGLNAGQNSSDALWRYELIATAGSGNSPSPLALSYESPIKLEGGVEVKARTFDGVDWSPISSATFKVNTIPASANNLVVSELNYRPEPATDEEKVAGFSSRGDFEFIELLNINTTRSINLEGVNFAGGIDFTFNGNLAAEALVLPPGGRVVLVDNVEAFNFRYPNSTAIIGGNYAGNLSNDGEQIHIVSSNGTTIKDFTYNDVAPWPTSPDGDGFTLTLVDSDKNPDHSDPSNWTASSNIGGSPGQADGEGFNGNPEVDQDGDGLNAFLEYAFGTNDSDSKSRVLPSIRLNDLNVNNESAQYLVFEFQKNTNAGGISYQIQVSGDLSTWSEASGEFTILSSQDNGDGTESVIYRSKNKFEENSNPRFYRLNVAIE